MSDDVYIKNIPLSYLKSQNQSFFGSDSFNDAIEIFNTYKNTVTESVPNNLNETIYPIEIFKDILISKYNDIPYVSNNTEINSDIIFIILSGKSIDSAAQLIPKKYVTKCVSTDIKDTGTLFANITVNNPIISAIKKAKKGISLSEFNNDPINNFSKPSNTSNTLLDIRNKANYYASLFHPDMYDDKAYKRSLMRRSVSNKTVPISTIPINGLIGNLTKEYPFENKDLLNSIENLKENIIYRYFRNKNNWNENIPKISSYEESNEYNIYLKNIDHSISKRNNISRFNLYEFIAVESLTDYTIIHGLESNNIRIEAYNNSGINISKDLYAYQVDDQNTISITFDSAFNGKILILTDSIKNSLINSYKFKDYEKLLKNNFFSKYKITTSLNKSIIDINNFDKHYGFIEVYHSNTNTIVPYTSLKYFEDYIEIEFGSNYIGLEVYFLPSIKILQGSSIIKINKNNIYTILNNYSILDETMKIWNPRGIN